MLKTVSHLLPEWRLCLLVLRHFLKSGDHILASRSLFGSSHQILTQILPKWGITHTYVDADKPKDWEKNIHKNTKMIFVETPSNPGLRNY